VPWEHITGQHHPVIQELDRAVGQVLVEGGTNAAISVYWPRYEVVLRFRRGVRVPITDALRVHVEAHPDKRPLKAYRGMSLVCLPAQHPAGETVTYRRDGQWLTIRLEPEPEA
jgi:hypothetical protein